MECNDVNIRQLVQTHLHGLNQSWVRVKDKVFAEQSVLVPRPPEVSKENIPASGTNDESLDIEPPLEKIPLSQDVLRAEQVKEADYVKDDHLNYQLMFSDMFDWLVRCEESVREQIPKSLNANKITEMFLKNMVSEILFVFV